MRMYPHPTFVALRVTIPTNPYRESNGNYESANASDYLRRSNRSTRQIRELSFLAITG